MKRLGTGSRENDNDVLYPDHSIIVLGVCHAICARRPDRVSGTGGFTFSNAVSSQPRHSARKFGGSGTRLTIALYGIG